MAKKRGASKPKVTKGRKRTRKAKSPVELPRLLLLNAPVSPLRGELPPPMAEEPSSQPAPAAQEEAVELSAEEALALISSMAAKDVRPQAPPLKRRGRCYVIAFEGPTVEPHMRVAGTTLARLYTMVSSGELDVELGPLCQTLDEFVTAWDLACDDVPTVVIANLKGSGDFISKISELRPGVAGAYWVVYETLRCEVSSATNALLSELRSRNRAKAIGYGPLNLLEAARRGAEAVRGHVEWGFGRPRLAEAC